MDLGGTLCKLCYFEKAVQDNETEEVKQFRVLMRKLLEDPASYGQSGWVELLCCAVLCMSR